MTVAFQKFQAFVADVANGAHDLSADVLKVLLTNVAPVATNAVKADLTEIAGGNGYTAGGATVTVTGSTQAGGLYKLTGTLPSPTWTGAGAGFGAYRYAVLWNSTPAAGPLIGWWDSGSSGSTAAGATFSVTLDLVNGILQLQ